MMPGILKFSGAALMAFERVSGNTDKLQMREIRFDGNLVTFSRRMFGLIGIKVTG